jgi:class 3 adenylate cyclase
MAVYQVPQKAFLRFLLSLCTAAGVLIFLYLFFSGPRLGPHYDYLTRYRSPLPVSHELVIIETDPASGGFIEPADAAVILMTLAELDARALAVQTPVLGKTGSAGPAGNDLPARLDEEFALLSRNIENLFQAILTGSVMPEEAEYYVDSLIGLSERGKERLLAALTRKDDAGMRRMERAAAVLGNVWEAGDVRFSSGEIPVSGPGLYSRSTADPDGVFRRIYPLAPGLKQGPDRAEHVVYAMLNRCLGPSEIEYRNGIPLLRFKREGFNRDIPLDSRGAVLTERPRGEENFRRLSPEVFGEYEKADRELALFLDTLREQGCFAYLAPEAYPTILYGYSHRLREELLEYTGEPATGELKSRWLGARTEYLRSLADFVNGPSETNLVTGYEERIAEEGIETAELRRLVSLRNDLIAAFAELRTKYDDFIRVRSGLSAALEGSFCILGPAASGPAAFPALMGAGSENLPNRPFLHAGREPVPSDAEVSAILANTILSGRAIVFPAGQYVLLWSLLTVLIILFAIRKPGPVLTLVAGLSMTILAGVVFSCGFVFTRYWLDPFIPAGSALAGTLTSFLYAFRVKHRNKAYIRRIYAAAAGPAYLKRLVRARLPPAGETIRTGAAIVAIRKGDLLAAESGKDPLDSAGEIRAFREAAARRFKNAGGVVVGINEDMVLIAFGSPLERAALRHGKTETPYNDTGQVPDGRNPAARAAGFISDLLKEVPEADAWRFGIDAGDCAFAYSELSGYAAFGRPVVYARILSGLASRYHARILVTARVSESIEGFLTRKLDAVADGAEKETFYEILTANS